MLDWEYSTERLVVDATKAAVTYYLGVPQRQAGRFEHKLPARYLRTSTCIFIVRTSFLYPCEEGASHHDNPPR